MKDPLLNFVEGLGVPLLNFEGGPGVPLLIFRGIPGPNFKLWEGSRVPDPGVLVPLLHYARYSEKLFSYWGNPEKKQTNEQTMLKTRILRSHLELPVTKLSSSRAFFPLKTLKHKS